LFSDYQGIDEREFMELVGEHVGDPHEPLDYDWAQAHKMDQKPWDYDKWTRIGVAPGSHK